MVQSIVVTNDYLRARVTCVRKVINEFHREHYLSGGALFFPCPTAVGQATMMSEPLVGERSGVL